MNMLKRQNLSWKNNIEAANFISQAEKFNWTKMPEDLRDGCYERCGQLLELDYLGSSVIDRLFDIMANCIIK